MPAIGGLNFLLKVNTGTDVSPVYTTLAGCKSATLSYSVDAIDTTTKDSAGWHEELPGVRNWNVDFDGLEIEDGSTFLALNGMFFNNTQLKIQMLTPANHTISGKVTLKSIDQEGSFDDAFKISGSFSGTGVLTFA